MQDRVGVADKVGAIMPLTVSESTAVSVTVTVEILVAVLESTSDSLIVETIVVVCEGVIVKLSVADIVATAVNVPGREELIVKVVLNVSVRVSVPRNVVEWDWARVSVSVSRADIVTDGRVSVVVTSIVTEPSSVLVVSEVFDNDVLSEVVEM